MKKATLYTTTMMGNRYAYVNVETNHSIRDAGVKLCKEHGTTSFTVVDYETRQEFTYSITCPGACVCTATF